MPTAWKRFFLIRVPLVLIAVGLAGQGLATALRHVPLRRSYMDDLALAVERYDQTQRRVVLLGDSITLASTRHFQLGRGRDDVANLATIAWTGAAAELFLLERYLAHHPPPQDVVYAVAIDDLQNNDSPQLVHYYDWNVYSHPAERSFLQQNVPGIDAREWRPAVLDIQENILERLLSLTKRSATLMPTGERPPDPAVRTEPETENRMGGSIQNARMRQKLVIGSLQAAVFGRICQLSQQYGFQFNLVWAPLPPPVRHEWSRRNDFAALESQLRTILGHDCNSGPVFDVNAQRNYTNFNRDGFHLHGGGWEERYAADLSQYIASLPDREANTAREEGAGQRSSVSRK